MGIDFMIGKLGSPGKLNNKYKGKQPDDPQYDGPLQVEIQENIMAPSVGWKLSSYDYFNKHPRIVNGKFNQISMGYGELENLQRKYPSLLLLNNIVKNQGGESENIPQNFLMEVERDKLIAKKSRDRNDQLILSWFSFWAYLALSKYRNNAVWQAH